MQPVNNLNFKQKTGLKHMMIHVELIIQVSKSNANLRCYSQGYVNIMIHTYLLKELYRKVL